MAGILKNGLTYYCIFDFFGVIDQTLMPDGLSRKP